MTLTLIQILTLTLTLGRVRVWIIGGFKGREKSRSRREKKDGRRAGIGGNTKQRMEKSRDWWKEEKKKDEAQGLVEKKRGKYVTCADLRE